MLRAPGYATPLHPGETPMRHAPRISPTPFRPSRRRASTCGRMQRRLGPGWWRSCLMSHTARYVWAQTAGASSIVVSPSPTFATPRQEAISLAPALLLLIHRTRCRSRRHAMHALKISGRVSFAHSCSLLSSDWRRRGHPSW